MSNSLPGRWIGNLPIRIRLTLAYLFALASILIIFAVFIYVRVRSDLHAQLDSALEVAAIQAIAVIDHEESELVFEELRLTPDFLNRMDHLSIHLLDSGGVLVDSIGGTQGPLPSTQFQLGYRSVDTAEGAWRIYSESIWSGDQEFIGWVQVTQRLDQIDEALMALWLQFLIGIPLALLLAGISGPYLAMQAMKPINQITRTARSIHENDLGQRIHYRGPTDEVGRLAETLDRMLDRLQSAFDRQMRFTSDAAHELRTPLGALKARIGVILSQPRTPTEYEAGLQDMDEQVDRLTRLTQELLFMARLDQQSAAISHEVIGFDEFIAGILDQVAPLAEKKSIVIHNRSPHPVSLVGNVDLLIRLFLNLLGNAIKYSPVGDEVVVCALAHKTTVSISIQDNGPGIAPDHLPHLFDRFYQIDSARSRPSNQSGGTGLGLAIAYEIARIHGGQLLVASEPDHGSTFTIELPAS